MTISDLMQRMSDAGAPIEAILIAVRAIEERDAEITARRAKVAEKKRGQRERKRLGDCPPTVHGQSDGQPSYEDTSTSRSSETKVSSESVRSARAKFTAPDGVSEEQWGGFLKLRSAKRQPMTARGFTLICRKLRTIAEHGFPPGDMIDLAIERGWTTVHEPKEQRNGNGRSDDGLSPTTRAALSVFGPAETGDEHRVPQ